MSKRNLLLVAAAGLALLLAGCVDGDGGNDATVVQMVSGDQFNPAELTISAGTTVMWHNVDNQVHNAVANNPDERGQWGMTSGNVLAGGEQFTYTFDEPGTYEYHCEPHAFVNEEGECSGMCGTIIVTAAEDAAE